MKSPLLYINPMSKTNDASASITGAITDKEKPKALLISPTFFDYYKDILGDFEDLGYEVVWVNTGLYENSVYKILLRVAPGLISRLSTYRYVRKIKVLHLEDVSKILVIKGEGLSNGFIRYLRGAFPCAHLYLYLWDSFENMPGAKQIALEFDSVSTFDPLDAKLFNWRYRPLFARKVESADCEASVMILYDWVFIGSLHSDRVSVLKRLTQSSRFQMFFAYGFIHGGLLWFLRHLTNPKLWCHGSIKVSTTVIPFDQVNRIAQASKAVVDIEHPKQRGLTMRSIETLLLGRKLVTTNAEIKHSDLFHETRVCVIDRNNPNIPQEFLDSPFLEIPYEIKERYLLRGWLKDVIDH
jgi:hypothetical protein